MPEPKPSQNPVKIKEDFFFSEKNKKLRPLISKIISSLSREESFDFQDKIAMYLRNMMTKYPDYKDREVFHILAGSSLYKSQKGIIEDDFPGDDSAEKFLNDFLNSVQELKDKVVKFEDFQFANVEWGKVKEQDLEYPPIESQESSVRLEIEGKIFTLTLYAEKSFSTYNNAYSFSIKFSILPEEPRSDGKEDFSGSIAFDFNDLDNRGLNTISTYIHKNPKGKLPRGFGIAMYKKILDFLPQQVKKLDADFVDIILRAPSDGLTANKWDQLFPPLLKARGYKKNAKENEGNWEKEYKALS